MSSLRSRGSRPTLSAHSRPTLQHSCPEPDEYIFTAWNQPFAPGDRRTAEDIIGDVNHEYHGPDTGMTSIRRTLLKSWWDVEQMTRYK